MKILLIGSLRHLSGPEAENFKKAARELGVALANSKHQVILCSTSPSALDRYVLEGMESSDTPNTVQLYFPLSVPNSGSTSTEDGIDNDFIDSLANIIVHPVGVGNGWRPTHVRAIRESELVLAIGGKERGTGSTVYSAEVLEKTVMPIPTFGGAAQSIFADLRRRYTEKEQSEMGDRYIENGKWGQNLLDLCVTVHKRRPMAINRTRDLLLNLAVSIALLAGFFALLLPDPTTTPVQAILLSLSIAIATMVGSAVRETMADSPTRWPSYLSIATRSILASIVIYLLAQVGSLVLNNDPLSITDSTELKTLQIKLAVFGLAAGLVWESFFSKLGEWAKGSVDSAIRSE
ncbi:hypothetical protein [Rhodococcus wratislaviensis]|uniref:Uncharacterized protein n=1 Tax=Rhodococcus wratislaviensis NBRC 100605 TaxID=1219028 RepID=X0Q3C9_RHOWR|nr:hypothetical protein [Rhodococcus wratislaviensis]GAF45562.1 hypothetical protein RW1_022_01420 [Rhodococcus wratislaviensis NBRC 100605]